jgi:type II secretory pathway predicted ATPase ExeA
MNANDESSERPAQVDALNDGPGRSTLGGNRPEASDDDYLDFVASLLPDQDRGVKEALERVKGVYVPCGRDRVLAETFSRFVVHMLAKRNGKRDDGRAFFITGESGAGKTWAVEHMLANHPALVPQARSFGTIDPVISVNLSGPSTLKTLGKMILRKAGYPIRQKMEQGELWDMLPEQLHVRKVLIVHIDETQHMLRHTETDQERKNLAKAFKGVMNYKEWPVSFIMSGMPETTEMSRLDEQIERRARFGFLPDIQLPEERGLVERVVSRMCVAGQLDPSRVISSDLPERIAHAARYRYGRIAQVVLAAIQMAFQRGDSALERDHFALAFLDHSHARGFDEMNPFLVDDWRRLEPGSFLIRTRDG